MKQAILISAHKEFNHLIDILDFFSGGNFEFYIHINKRSKPDPDYIKKIQAYDVKFLSRKYDVKWGGACLLKSVLLMAEEALKNKENTYFHWISGQDFPVKELSYFENILDKNKNYLEYFEMPAASWKNGGMDRIELYNLYDVFNAEKHLKIIKLLQSIQKKLYLKRAVSDKIPELFGGSAWWSLTRDTLKYVIEYTKTNGYLLKRMKHTFAAEEMYFQTLVMNSAHSKNIVNDNLRYIDWSDANGGHPGILDASHFSSIVSSNKLFARKFCSTRSNELKSFVMQKFCNKDYRSPSVSV